MAQTLRYLKFIGFLLLTVVPSIRANASNIQVDYFDSDQDGYAELLLIESSNSIVSISYKKNRVQVLEIIRNYKRVTAISRYKRFQDFFVYDYGYATNKVVFRGRADSSPDNACIRWHGPGLKDLELISQKSSIKQECTANELPASLEEAANSILGTKQDFGACISHVSQTAQTYWAKLKRSFSDYTYCTVNDPASKNCEGSFNKDSKEIKISSVCFDNPVHLRKIFQHELLHASGILEEGLADCVGNFCPSSDKVKSCAANILAAQPIMDQDVLLLPTSDSTGAATPAAAAQTTANTAVQVPKQIAAGTVPQPSPAELRVTGGSRSFSVAANSQSFPAQMLRFAESAVLPNAAFASSDSASLASTRGSSARAPSGSSLPKARAASNAARGIASTAPVSSKSGTTAGAPNIGTSAVSLETDSAKSTTEAIAQRTARSGTDGKAKGPTAARNSGGSAAPIATSGSRPNNTRRGTTASATNYSGEQLVQILKQDSYSEVKRRLQEDAQFVDALRANGITIYNTRGEQIGASSGQIIFSDTGNRFVQGK